MDDIKTQLENKKGKIVWLASYPKSGNTWFRCFLSALIDQKIDLNNLRTDGIYSGRFLFDSVYDIDSRLLSEDEVKLRMPNVIRFHASKASNLMFCKIHDAYSHNLAGEPIIPEEVTQSVIYLIRNPLDVVSSYANHMNTSVAQAIVAMNKRNGYLARQANGLNINSQFPQLMYSWSGHVRSWHHQNKIPVTTIRYEDMKNDGLKTFTKAVKSMGLEVDETQIQRAIEMTEFDKIKEKEAKEGFKEKNIKSKEFFRKGQVNGYLKELTKEQVETIIKNHGEVMKEYGYLPA